MLRIVTLSINLTFLLLYSIASASVLDAPHNETNNISCGDCHTYSLWWQYSPATINETTPYDTITDAVCSKCHTQAGYPNKIGHSYISMANMHDTATGNWTTKCIDCHDPHHQRQLDLLITNPTLADKIYLVTSTVESIIGTTATETTFSYLPPVVNNTAWADPATWSAKTSPSRGLILLLDGNTYEVNGANAGITGSGNITIQGIVDTSVESHTFHLIYGQLIKSVITTPNPAIANEADRDVQFFDPKGTTGSFVDQINTPPKGVCQVCHTQTTYWLEDGSQAIHNSGLICTSCHDTSLGFKPINADHTSHVGAGSNDGTCITCHTGTDVILDVHNGHCEDCHINPPDLKWVPPNTSGINYCTDCHDSNGPGTNDIAGDFKNHPKALDHTGQVVTVPQCVDACHFHNNKDVINEIHDPAATGDPCNHCHDIANGGVLKSLATAGPGDCGHCHTNIAEDFLAHPNASTHAGQVDSTPECVRCHKLDSPSPGSPDPTVGNIHGNLCGYCHGYNNNGTSWGMINLAATYGPGDCVHCHGDFFLHTSTIANNPSLHDTTVTNETACFICHDQTDPVADIHFNHCEDCHDSLGNLKGSAIGHGAADTGFANPNVCTTCHVESKWRDAALHPDHSAASNKILPKASCVSCHVGDLIDAVHNNGVDSCLLCHVSLKPTEIHTLSGSAVGNNQGGDCDVCHTPVPPNLDYFEMHSGNVTHPNLILSTGTNCTATCHAGAPVLQIHYPGGTCGACHVSDGTLIGSAAGKGTGKPPTGGLNCVDCHDNGFDSLHTTSGKVDLSHGTQVTAMTPQNCTVSGCHDEVSALGAGIYVGSSSVHTQNTYSGTDSCVACHDAVAGALKSPAIPSGGDCKTCHTNVSYNNNPHI